MKIGIVGLGYWGKIILNNFRELGYNNIVICEKEPIDWAALGSKYETVENYKHMQCDKVFVLTPATMHYNICEHFLQQGVDVFCEKPLDQSSKKCKKLFNLANKHGATLFVDWLFTFNPAVHKIKSLIKEWGKPTNIIANRMNYGPVRHDVNARWDLASHDVSIACYLLDEAPHTVQWLDFKRDSTSDQEDSVVGVLSFEKTCMQINASWKYNTKNRLYVFEFENGFLYWDDTTKSIIWGSESLEVDKTSPLHSSISSFFNSSDPTLINNEALTYSVTKILEL